jgi:hypothetical protein
MCFLRLPYMCIKQTQEITSLTDLELNQAEGPAVGPPVAQYILREQGNGNNVAYRVLKISKLLSHLVKQGTDVSGKSSVSY